jgi:hypothetical protein
MPVSRRHIVVVSSTGLFGCVTAPVDYEDGSPVAPDRAVVLVHPRYSIGRRPIDLLEVGLTRLESGKPPENLLFSRVPNNEVSVLAVPPGYYFLRGLRVVGGGYYRHTFEPRLTLFAARASQINYPGDWVVEVTVLASSVSGTVARGYVSAEYEIRATTVENSVVPALFASKYPLLNSRLPLKLTRATDN